MALIPIIRTPVVPVVAVPIANDQPGIAARIKHFGVGEFIPPIISQWQERDAQERVPDFSPNGADLRSSLMIRVFTISQRLRRLQPKFPRKLSPTQAPLDMTAAYRQDEH